MLQILYYLKQEQEAIGMYSSVGNTIAKNNII